MNNSMNNEMLPDLEGDLGDLRTGPILGLQDVRFMQQNTVWML